MAHQSLAKDRVEQPSLLIEQALLLEKEGRLLSQELLKKYHQITMASEQTHFVVLLSPSPAVCDQRRAVESDPLQGEGPHRRQGMKRAISQLKEVLTGRLAIGVPEARLLRAGRPVVELLLAKPGAASGTDMGAP